MAGGRLLLFLTLLVGHTQVATAQECLDASERLSRGILPEMIHKLRTSQPIKMAIGSWGTHKLMSEIYRILVAEYLGHNVEVIPIGGTTGAYHQLAVGGHDVNVELWQSVAAIEYEEQMVIGALPRIGSNLQSRALLRPPPLAAHRRTRTHALPHKRQKLGQPPSHTRGRRRRLRRRKSGLRGGRTQRHLHAPVRRRPQHAAQGWALLLAPRGASTPGATLD